MFPSDTGRGIDVLTRRSDSERESPAGDGGAFLNFNSEFEGLSVGTFVVLTAAIPGRCSPVTGAPPLEESRCAARGFSLSEIVEQIAGERWDVAKAGFRFGPG
jgi:hypothetical protein